MKHSWTDGYEPQWMDTVAGRACGGFSSCTRCGLMRFSIAGHPPRHYYVTREHLTLNKDNTKIRPGAPDVRPIAGPCSEVKESA